MPQQGSRVPNAPSQPLDYYLLPCLPFYPSSVFHHHRNIIIVVKRRTTLSTLFASCFVLNKPVATTDDRSLHRVILIQLRIIKLPTISCFILTRDTENGLFRLLLVSKPPPFLASRTQLLVVASILRLLKHSYCLLCTNLVAFIRDHPASEVYVTGTFDGWSKSEKLERVGNGFSKEVDLTNVDEKIYYKVRALRRSFGVRKATPG